MINRSFNWDMSGLPVTDFYAYENNDLRMQDLEKFKKNRYVFSVTPYDIDLFGE